MDSLFLWLARHWRGEMYLIGSKTGGILCSFADIAMVWMFLKIAEELRGSDGGRSYLWRFRILALFALLTPTLALPRSSRVFFILQFLVLGIPYLILLQAVITEMKPILAHIREHLDKNRT
ncbi:MAG: hypothetical protein LBR61_12800 [Synergistaceae bacterium]|jgi:hypothetical protein|nr:hypothetical protein [Synergistaceae bacterium]